MRLLHKLKEIICFILIILVIIFAFSFIKNKIQIKNLVEQNIVLEENCNQFILDGENLNQTIDQLVTENNLLQEKLKEEQVNRDKTPNFSARDIYLIAKLTCHEAGADNTDEAQRAIVSVIINRVNSGYWENAVSSKESDVYNVIFAKNQFTPARRLKRNYNEVPERVYKNVYYVIENGVTIPTNIMYFCSSKIYRSFGRVAWKNIGGNVFCY